MVYRNSHMKEKTKRRPAWGRIIPVLIVLIILGVVLGRVIHIIQAYRNDVEVESPYPDKYPVRGVDVSRYQGNIDWEVLVSQDVTFAFIKATEGSVHQDPLFEVNWENAQKTDVYISAYHFFSYESSGETQAQNYIETVGRMEGMLPPVVDVELYSDYYEHPLPKSEARAILDPLLKKLEDYYGVKPIIYTTLRAYYYYILGGGYGDYPLWVRDTHVEPFIPWRFWQYSDHDMLEGYDGKQADQIENCIDLNVYHGDLDAFLKEFNLPAREEETQ